MAYACGLYDLKLGPFCGPLGWGATDFNHCIVLPVKDLSMFDFMITIETIWAIFVYKQWKKTAFESLSRDFSSFKNVVVSVTNLCQDQLKISRENTKLPRKPQLENNLLPQDIDWRHAVLSYYWLRI